MEGPAAIFLEKMEGYFGAEPQFYKGVPAKDGLMPPAVLVFKNFPEYGFTTCVTYGLSFSDHPAWKMKRRPELVMTVNSRNVAWATALADMVSEMRGQFPFSYGQTIICPGKMVEASAMDGFLVFAPPFLTREQYLDIDIGVEGYKICLTGIYPVTQNEIALLNKVVLERFWKREGFDCFDVYR